MKRTIITLAIMMVAVTIVPATAQKDYKFGKVTKAELLRTDFPDIADGAKMVVLNEYIEANLWKRKEFLGKSDATGELLTTETVRTIDFCSTKRIKIIEPEASGNTEITFTLASNEALLSKRIKVVHYALRNNKLIRHKFSVKELKQTMFSDSSINYSFVIPDTKISDIFEFTYSKIIDLTEADMYDLPLQQDIPVLGIQCDLATPIIYYWDAVKDPKKIFRTGKYPISERRTIGTRMYSTKLLTLDIFHKTFNKSANNGSSDIFIYEATNLPAITDESDGEIAKIRVIFNGDSPE